MGWPLTEVIRITGNIQRAFRDTDDPIHGIIEAEVIRPDGRLIPVEAVLWTTGDGSTWMRHALVRDISERKAQERELHELNRDLNDFAGIAAHDLRSPFATIGGFTELVREDAEDNGNQLALNYIERIERATRRGVDLIDDLLAYSRAGQTATDLEPVDLDEIAQDVAAEVVSSSDRDPIVEVADLPVATVDRGAIRQVFANLVSNAVNYCPDDRVPHVRIEVLERDRQGHPTIAVTDNGAGIPEDEQAKLFDMFQRGSTSGTKSGSGIGLAICRRVIERHAGRIWIESPPEGGTSFRFTVGT